MLYLCMLSKPQCISIKKICLIYEQTPTTQVHLYYYQSDTLSVLHEKYSTNFLLYNLYERILLCMYV